MFKRFALSAIFMAAGTTIAMAAPVKATVTSVQDKTIVVKVDGEKAAWFKKGTMIRINKKFNGKITDVTDDAATLSSPKAGELKAGEAITIDKSLATSGC
jgi:preprotein translocase subunit YajC